MVTVEAIRRGLACAVQLPPGTAEERNRPFKSSTCKTTRGRLILSEAHRVNTAAQPFFDGSGLRCFPFRPMGITNWAKIRQKRRLFDENSSKRLKAR